MIAALYVAAGGIYYDLEGVEPWGEDRDARLYDGPWPVVAHPPCARWCRLAGLVEARYPHLKKGEDDGCFASALDAVRKWGGVLEHPAFSDAFTAFGLPIPDPRGGWQRGICGGWSCYVEQGRYGHPAKKATWLYAYGIDSPPALSWGRIPDQESKALVSWCGNRTTEARRALVGGGDTGARYAERRAAAGKSGESKRRRLGAKEVSVTPEPFRDGLLEIARGAWGRKTAAGRRIPNSKQPGDQPELSAKARGATPEPFRDTLLDLARSRN